MKKSLEKILDMVEKLRLELLKIADQYNAELLRSSSDVPDEDFIMPPQYDWKVENNNDYIKIIIPDVPIKNKRTNKESYRLWQKNIKAALWSIKCPSYKKVFVYIKLFYPGRLWDADNRLVKPILDGIVLTGLIKDDTISHLAYGVEGNISETPYTKIYIFDYNNIGKILPVICNND